MRYLCAPIQGFTDYVWRRAHASHFGGVERYYSPFLRIERGEMRKRDLADVNPVNNAGLTLVPQIIGCQPEQAQRLVLALRDMGYSEVDINMGCPYPPMALHHKGSGLIPHPAEVEALFSCLAGIDGVSYSIKMRLGWDEPRQWREIVPLFDILRPTQVTIHPRVGKQQYKGDLVMEEMDAAVELIRYPLVYNGDVTSLDDAVAIERRYPSLSAIMIGRALVQNPALLCPEKASPAAYRALHDEIYADYEARMNGGDKQLVIKMKALWEMYLPFAPKKQLKAVKKASNLDRYNAAVSALFAEMEGDLNLGIRN